jgi:hypothetical protein
MGSEDCMFSSLLLTFGDTADFSKGNLVMAIDGEKLKANSANSVSGSFSAANAWGEGNLNFAAMAMVDETGEKWLSNVVSFDAAAANEPKTVAPRACDMDVNHLEDGIYPVAFDRGDVMKGASGIYMNAVHVFSEDMYNFTDLEALKAGDSIIVNGETVLVDTIEIEIGDVAKINGGALKGGIDLVPVEEGDIWRFCGDDDISAYTDQGVTTLVVDPSVTYTDRSDIEADPVNADYEGMVDAMMAAQDDTFDQYNTTVRIEAGKVIAIDRVFRP